MKKAILTTKVGMTQIFNEDGVLTPVTVLQAGANVPEKSILHLPRAESTRQRKSAAHSADSLAT